MFWGLFLKKIRWILKPKGVLGCFGWPFCGASARGSRTWVFEHYKPRALSNLGWREVEPLFEKTHGLKVRPELTTWVYGAWCGHLCSQCWAWWRTKRSTVLVLWLEHWPHGTSCAVGMYWRYLGWADPMRSHSFNQSIAELWRDQPPFCWTAPTRNVDSPLLPAESPSNGYYTTTSYYEFLEHLWHDVGGSKEFFKQKRFLRSLRSSFFKIRWRYGGIFWNRFWRDPSESWSGTSKMGQNRNKYQNRIVIISHALWYTNIAMPNAHLYAFIDDLIIGHGYFP